MKGIKLICDDCKKLFQEYGPTYQEPWKYTKFTCNKCAEIYVKKYMEGKNGRNK